MPTGRTAAAVEHDDCIALKVGERERVLCLRDRRGAE
jgi:hypothetical protein